MKTDVSEYESYGNSNGLVVFSRSELEFDWIVRGKSWQILQSITMGEISGHRVKMCFPSTMGL